MRAVAAWPTQMAVSVASLDPSRPVLSQPHHVCLPRSGVPMQEAIRNALGMGGFGGGFQRGGRRGPAVVRTAMRVSFDEAVKGTTKQVWMGGDVVSDVCAVGGLRHGRCWDQAC